MLVEKGNTLKGSFSIEGDLVVEGTLSGDVEVGGTLTVERGGEASGALRCRRAMVKGVLSGTLTCSERADVEPTARVAGRVVAPEVVFGETLEAQARPSRRPEPAHTRPAHAVPGKIPLVTGTSGKLLVRPTAVLKEGKS